MFDKYVSSTIYPATTCRESALSELAMYLFCPTCGNLLVVEEGPSCNRFSCNTCPYVQNIRQKVGHTSALNQLLFYSYFPFIGLFLQVSKVKGSGWCVGRICSMGECGHNRWYVQTPQEHKSSFHFCGLYFQKHVRSAGTPKPTSCRCRLAQRTNPWPSFSSAATLYVITAGRNDRERLSASP